MEYQPVRRCESLAHAFEIAGAFRGLGGLLLSYLIQ